MQTGLVRRSLGIRCRDLHARARRIVLAAAALAILLASPSAFAWPPDSADENKPPARHRAGSADITDEVGPLQLTNSSFNISGTDAKGVQHDQWLSGNQLGVRTLVFDQFAISTRFAVTDHFSIGLPISIGGGPVSQSVYSANSPNSNAIRANGDSAAILGVGLSPGYEIYFGDAAVRIDTALLVHAEFIPTNLSTLDKYGKTVTAEAVGAQLAFEPRLTILPYARGDIGAGFYAEVDAIHPENWSCGAVLQLRFGRGS